MPDQESNPDFLLWELGVLATPREAPFSTFSYGCLFFIHFDAVEFYTYYQSEMPLFII